MTERYDVVVAGGGVAGLTLAWHLAHGPWRDRRVAVVDDGRHPVDARSWACWTRGPGLLAACASHSYDRLTVHARERGRTVAVAPYRYHVVAGARLRDAVREATAGLPGFEQLTGTVRAVVPGSVGATVVLDDRELQARWVLDGVLADPGRPSGLALVFGGLQVVTERPVFDPGAATFFDFRTAARPGESRFVYVLPHDRTHALVELTGFTTGAPRPPADTESAVHRYLSDVVGTTGYRVAGHERGALPLTLPRPRPRTGPVLPVGVHGGLLRASTGFAVTRIERDAAAVASSLARHGHPFAIPGVDVRRRYLDRVWLDAVRRRPELLETAFARLFAANPPARVLAFLDGATTAGQEAALVATLPPAPFLAAAARVRAAA